MAEQIPLTILEKVVEKLVDPIIRQFSYLFRYKRNIKSLTDGVQDLQNKKAGVTLSVDDAKRKLRIIGPDVEAWLGKVEEIEKKAQEVVEGTKVVKNGCLNGWCPNLKQRYLLSRKAVKQTMDVKELQRDREKLTQLSYPALPASMVASTSATCSEAFESRISQTKKVIEALKNEKITKIGICGLGGVGKTRMATDIRNRAKVENLFDEVTMAVVSQNQDLKKIQDQLASMLGLELEANNSIDDRGKRLRERLTQSNQILVILDDVWKQLDLGELGIPVGGQGDCKGCKVLITSRDEHVCITMGTQKIFPIQLLSDQEAWDLFKEKAGDRVEIPDLHSIAKKVVDECGRLPLAIVTVATALKGRGKDVWLDALEQLKTSNVTCIDGMVTNVYSSLRFSYDYLESNQLRRLFMLCCIFPEDYAIPLEILVRYAIGLRLFTDVRRLASVRRKVKSLVDQLQSCYLLLPSEKKWHVKMHDVVRDFGLMEASKEASSCEHVYLVRHGDEFEEWWQNDTVEPYTAISIGSRKKLELPRGLGCPSLQLLRLTAKGSIQISRDCFGGMKELRVVSFAGQFIAFDYENMPVESPPKALQFLVNVRTLCLEHCRFSTGMGLIGSMQHLEILSFFGSKVDVLPSEIGQLSNLKLLDLRSCNVGLIPPGVLSCLKKLEDLYMGYYFRRGEVENGARITELDSLSGLKCLQVSMSEPKLLLKLNHFLFDKLTSLVLTVYYVADFYDFQNKVILEKVDLGLLFRDKIGALMRRTEVLSLNDVKGRKNIIKESDEDGFMNLKELSIFRNDDLVEICQGNLPTGSMGMLEKVDLRNLSAMRYLWRGHVQPPCLVNLKVFEMSFCKEIRSLFSPSVVRCLVQLQTLKIEECGMLEEIISKDGAEDDKDAKMIEFPKLNEVKLTDLPRLRSIGPVADVLGSNDNHDGSSLFNEVLLPSMETLTLAGVPAQKILVGGQMQPAGSLYKLRVLKIHECAELCGVAAFEAIKLLQNLERLDVQFCDSMDDFEGLEEVLDEHGEEVIMLPQLNSISIEVLSELRHIWKNVPKQGLMQGFHKLTSLQVCSCHKLTYLLSPSMAKLLVNLQEMKLEDCGMMEQVIKMDEEEEEESCCEIEKKMDTIVFPRLRQLDLRSLKKLTAFCQGSHDLEFPSLEEVKINECPKMKNFGSGSLSAPKLESVEFDGQSLWMGDLNNTIRHINERFLSISSCDKLCGIAAFEAIKLLQNLETLSVYSCHSMETVFDFEGLEEVLDEHGEEVIMLPQLYSIKISYLLELRHIWKNVPKQGLMQGFHKLTSLQVSCCRKLMYLLSPSMAKLLVNLQVINVEDCEMMEQVIKMDEEEEEESCCEIEKKMDTIVFPLLHQLSLRHLKKLTAFCQGSHDLEFPSLEKVSIVNCRNKKNFCSGSLSTPKLESVEFGGQSLWMGDLNNTIRRINERFLSISSCDKLCGVAAFEAIKLLQNLETLSVYSCHSMETVFDFEGLEEVLDEHGEEVIMLPQLNSIFIISLNELRHIWKNVPKQGLMQGFHKLTSLQVYRCPKLTYLLSPSMVKLLVNLQVINVEDCGMMEQVIKMDEEEEEEESCCEIEKKMDTIVFPLLRQLSLRRLKKLTAFCQGSHDLEFPSLEKVKISECPKMNNFGSGSLTTPKLESVEFKIFQSLWMGDLNNTIRHINERFLTISYCDKLCGVAAFEAIKLLQNLETLDVTNCHSMETVFDFEGLEEVLEEVIILPQLNSIFIISLNELRHIWKNVPKQGLMQGFHKLTSLKVYDCPKLMYLLSPSMAKLLVNLQVINVEDCGMMEQVIKMDEEEEEEESCCEIEKKMDTIVFPLLRQLSLRRLKKLTAFCQGSHDLEFPSLEKVKIIECPKMKNFGSGSLTAPKLESVEFDGQSLWMGDLNNTIRHINER